ncbi:MAG: GyrI-like domain-containing protein [Hamadaea sp.]|nr:GyrI-like domain-containing protein [Hamadaea sp.]
MTAIETRSLAPQAILSIRQTIATMDLPRVQGENLRTLWQVLTDRGVTPAGPPIVRYHTFSDAETDVEVGVPVSDAVPGEGSAQPGHLPAGPAVVAVHLGGHDRLGEAYQALQKAVADNGTARGPSWEVYEWIDLNEEPDPSRWPAPDAWRTQLVQPIQ